MSTLAAIALPSGVAQLTITTTKCPHRAVSRYTPDTPPGIERVAVVAATALRDGWAAPDESGLVRVAELIARNAAGGPLLTWIVPTMHGFHWLRNRLDLAATHVGCAACDPMRIVQVDQ